MLAHINIYIYIYIFFFFLKEHKLMTIKKEKKKTNEVMNNTY